MSVIHATFEDLHMFAHSADGHEYTVRLSDHCTGKVHDTSMTPTQLSLVMQMNLDLNGELATEEATLAAYETLKDVLDACPPECRPVP
jgi:hypothetical protein